MAQHRKHKARRRSQAPQGLRAVALVALVIGKGLEALVKGGGARSSKSSRSRARSRLRRPRKRLAVVVVTLVVAVGGLVGSAATASADVVLNGITVGGIPVDGLEGRQLVYRLAPAADEIVNRPLELTVGKRTWTRTPAQLGVTVNLSKTAAKALRAGRDGPFGWIFHSLGARQERLTWTPRIDQERFATSIAELAKEVRVKPSNGNVTLKGAEVKVEPPSEGVELLTRVARQEVIKASLRPPKSGRLPLPVTITDPDIGLEEAEKIKEKAQAILLQPAVFLLDSKQLTLPPAALASALRVGVVDGPSKNASLRLTADPEALRNQLVKLDAAISKEPKDASFTVAGNAVRINPSTDGVTVNTDAASVAVIGLAEKHQPIPLSSKPLPAKFTTDAAAGLGIKNKISTFTTFFDPENAPRVANIDRMASAIDGKVLKPGESFSLNASTGRRTPQNGYQEAPIINDGELVPGIGGGVCQVATTLFNAVFLAGLDIVERGNHSLHVSKYPMGRDAMVSYGSQDLRFKNDTSFGMLLKAAVTPKALAVSIYSSPLDRVVETTTSDQRNPSAPSTKIIDDPALPSGQQLVVEEGKPGFDVTVTRRVTSGGQMLHSDTFISKYKPWKRIIRKGTGAPVAAPPATAAPAPPPPPLPAPPVPVDPIE